MFLNILSQFATPSTIPIKKHPSGREHLDHDGMDGPAAVLVELTEHHAKFDVLQLIGQRCTGGPHTDVDQSQPEVKKT